MNPTTKQEWDEVHQVACDIANAAAMDDDVLVAHHTPRLFDLLDALDAVYGPKAALVATRADFTEQPQEQRRLYEHALGLARREGDKVEEAEILESLAELG